MRDDLRWEQALASLSLAGIGPLAQDTLVVTAGAEDTYTMADQRAKRVVVVHAASGNLDIRFDLNAAASATDFPILPLSYFVLEAKVGDILHFFNNNASDVTVNIMEIR